MSSTENATEWRAFVLTDEVLIRVFAMRPVEAWRGGVPEDRGDGESLKATAWRIRDLGGIALQEVESFFDVAWQGTATWLVRTPDGKELELRPTGNDADQIDDLAQTLYARWKSA